MFVYPQNVKDALWAELTMNDPLISAGAYGYCYSVKFAVLVGGLYAVYEHPRLGVHTFANEKEALDEFNRYLADRQLEPVTMDELQKLKEESY